MRPTPSKDREIKGGAQVSTLPVMAGARDGCAARTRLLVWIIVAMQLVALHGAAASSLLCRYVANALKLQPRPMRAARAAGAARHGPVVFTHTHTHTSRRRGLAFSRSPAVFKREMAKSPSRPLLPAHKMTLKRTDDPWHDLSALPADTVGGAPEVLSVGDSRQPSPPRARVGAKPSSTRRKLARTDSPQSMDLGGVLSRSVD